MNRLIRILIIASLGIALATFGLHLLGQSVNFGTILGGLVGAIITELVLHRED